MSYNPTDSDMVDYVLIGGTEESSEIPSDFKEVWHSENDELRNNWREAIGKEIEGWRKRGVCS